MVTVRSCIDSACGKLAAVLKGVTMNFRSFPYDCRQRRYSRFTVNYCMTSETLLKVLALVSYTPLSIHLGSDA
jgi:hypothetical protein